MFEAVDFGFSWIAGSAQVRLSHARLSTDKEPLGRALCVHEELTGEGARAHAC